jgi:hypothetical protein
MTTCNDCETVAHCLKHGCMPKVRSTIDMARKAGGRAQQNKNCDVEYVMSADSLKAFEVLVCADEREACAKACKAIGQHNIIDQCAAAIRARGQS